MASSAKDKDGREGQKKSEERGEKKKTLEALTENMTARLDELDNSDERRDEETVWWPLTTRRKLQKLALRNVVHCGVTAKTIPPQQHYWDHLWPYDSHAVCLEKMVASIAVLPPSFLIELEKSFVLLLLIVIIVFVESEMDTLKQ